MTNSSTREAGSAPTLADYLAVLRRRKWLFLTVALLVPLAATLVSMRGPQLYEGFAQVLLKRQDLTSSLSGVQAPYTDPTRATQTEAKLARVPEVLARAIEAVPESNMTPLELQKRSSVTTEFGTDILTFSVEDPRPEVVQSLATAYAHAFTEYRQDLDTAEIARIHESVKQQIRKLEREGLPASAAYRTLVQKERQIAAVRALQTPTAVVVHEADRAEKVPSTATRNGLLALVLGVLFGLGAVFLREALDSRVRSVDTVRETLGLRVLGKLPDPPRRLRKNDRLVMMAVPLSHEAEPFRTLRAGLDFANSEVKARTILVTSALDDEGKSTTVSNLALALARAGRHVVLADFDLRSPSVHQLFDLPRRPGLTDVELDGLRLERVLHTIDDGVAEMATLGPVRESPGGRLEVLCAGRALDNPDRVATESAFENVLHGLGDRGEIVLIDSAPLLPIGDTLVLSSKVDAMILVVRQDALASETLRNVEDALASVPAAKLGLILTGVDRHEALGQYRYPRSQATDGQPVENTSQWSSTKVSDEPYTYVEAASLEE